MEGTGEPREEPQVTGNQLGAGGSSPYLEGCAAGVGGFLGRRGDRPGLVVGTVGTGLRGQVPQLGAESRSETGERGGPGLRRGLASFPLSGKKGGEAQEEGSGRASADVCHGLERGCLSEMYC